MRFFDTFPSIAEELDIVVEGACPVSSYIGAELRMPIDEANELAARHGYPVWFQGQA